ncbi:hypothetical protein D0T87_09580 [Bacteroides sp. 51]|nr:hypothetical protein [Bacteroides sp. 51]
MPFPTKPYKKEVNETISHLSLIYQQTNELRGKKKKSGENFSTLSASVPRPGMYRTTKRTDWNTKE